MIKSGCLEYIISDHTPATYGFRGFLFRGYIHMKKPFKTIDEQIVLLEKRGLDISDKDDVRKKLLHNNYYTVINGYKYPFLEHEKCTKEIEKYKEGTTFNELFALYKFDCNLRALLFKYILHIEHQLKSVISHFFAKNHINEPYPNYLEIKNFDIPSESKISKNKLERYDELKIKISEELEHQRAKNNSMIKHYDDNYGNLPPWILVSIFSFGMLRTFFDCLSIKEQNEIARFFNLRPDELNTYLSALNIYRNACAHDERIYNLKLRNKVVRKDKDDTKKVYDRVYVVILILKDMLDAASFMEFYSKFNEYVGELETNLKTVKLETIFGAMGMPVEKSVRKSELGPLERGDALSHSEFKDVLEKYIIPMLPITTELKLVDIDDINAENRSCRLVELKNDTLYFAQSTNGIFTYSIELMNSTIAQLQIETIQEHLQTLIDYIHVFWNLGNLSVYGRDKVAIAFPTLCEQAYELTICNLMCKGKSKEAMEVFNQTYRNYQKMVGLQEEEKREELANVVWEKKDEVDKIIVQEDIAEKTLYGILTQIEAWANKTYEGQKKTFGIIICKNQMSNNRDSFNYIEFLKNDYSATINDGMYSAVEVYADGMFKEHLAIEHIDKQGLYSIPYPFSGFADLCTEDKIGVLLTISGDILIINDRKLCYTRHNGHWVQSMADKVIEQMKGELNLEDNESVEAIYQALVDVSYSRGGACMGIMVEDVLPQKLQEMVKMGLLCEDNEDNKLNAIKKMISSIDGEQKNFFALDRPLRRELLELDGAMVLSSNGHIHVIGTIIRLDGSGSDGGGRTAAAKQLSEYGLAVKVSQDGYVHLYKNREVILKIMT